MIISVVRNGKEKGAARGRHCSITHISHVLRRVSVCLVSLEDLCDIKIRAAVDLADEVYRVCAVLGVICVCIVPFFDEVLVSDVCVSLTFFL